jgi:hypothetical protein
LVTVALSLVREHTEKVKPPRAVFVPFPLGLPVGHPGDSAEQQRVLDLAFSTLGASNGPVLVDYHDEAAAQEAGSPLQASEVEVGVAARTVDFATEVTLMRRYWEQRVAETGRSGVGLSGIPPQRFRGIVRFLETYLSDPSEDMPERAAETPIPLFIRNCVEDLRVMYAEARMQTHPLESSIDRQRWILSETAFGRLVRDLRDAMEASDDPKVKAAAFGIAR